MPWTPAPSAQRISAPRLPGSVTPSIATMNGGLPGRLRVSAAISISGRAEALASTPWGASQRAWASSLVRDTSITGMRMSWARSTMSSMIWLPSNSREIHTSRTFRRPAISSSRTACNPSTCSPPRPFSGNRSAAKSERPPRLPGREPPPERGGPPPVRRAGAPPRGAPPRGAEPPAPRADEPDPALGRPVPAPLGAPDRGAPDRGAPDRGAPDRGAPDRGAPDRGAPDFGAPDRAPPDDDGRPPVALRPRSAMGVLLVQHQYTTHLQTSGFAQDIISLSP